MREPWRSGLLLGFLNGSAAVAVLGLVEWLTRSDTEWFAYSPLNDIIVQERSFPWPYVVVPLALLALNVTAVAIYLRRRQR